MITSFSNPRIKLVKSLGLRKNREKNKKFVVEGIHLVSEALNVSSSSGQFKIDFVLFSKKVSSSTEGRKLLKGLSGAGVEVLEVPDQVMRELSEVENPQGILAVTNIVEYGVQELVYSDNPLVVVCAGVQDPGNLGTIIRTADAAGCSGVAFSKGTVDVFSGKVVRSSMGSVFHLPLVILDDVADGIGKLKKAGLKVIATSPAAETRFWDADFSGSAAFVMGAEGSGLPKSVLAKCDEVVSIPMRGKIESLNVAVSASILLYEALSQRMKLR